jgi:hypothetical protein
VDKLGRELKTHKSCSLRIQQERGLKMKNSGGVKKLSYLHSSSFVRFKILHLVEGGVRVEVKMLSGK